MSTEPLDADLTELERRLNAMPPAPTELSRERLLFLAGGAAARRSGRRLRMAVSALLTGAGLAIGLGLGTRLPREPVVIVRVVPEPTPQPVPEPAPAPTAARERGIAVARAETDPRQFPAAPGPWDESLLWRQRMAQASESPLSAADATKPMASEPLEELLDLSGETFDAAQLQRWQSTLHPGEQK